MKANNSVIMISFFIAFMAFSDANAQQKNRNIKKSAVLSQEIMLEYMFNIDRDCRNYGEIRIAVLVQPKHGRMTVRPFEVAPSFKQDNPRHHCNKDKVMAVAAYYQANEGFRGPDRAKFAIVFHDGEAWVYNAEITVWGP